MAPLRWPVFAAVAVLVVAWVGFAALRSPDEPSEPPTLNRNIVASFWSVPITGGKPQLLFRTRGWQDGFPTYRRDGSILFVRATGLAQPALLSRTSHREVRRLRALPVLTQLAYSQTTDEIAVWRTSGLYAESLDGERRRLLARNADVSAVWSPNGGAFAFARQTSELVVRRGAREQVFRLGAGAPRPLALSPKADRLLFTWGKQLFVLDARSGRRRLFANVAAWAAWSPNGRTIAYLSARGIVVRDVRTSRDRLLVPGLHTGWASFSPDGRTLLYVTQKVTKSAQLPS